MLASLVREGRRLADARQNILGGGVLADEVVEVIGGDDLDVQLAGHPDEVFGELAIVPATPVLLGMVLDLDVEVLAKD